MAGLQSPSCCRCHTALLAPGAPQKPAVPGASCRHSTQACARQLLRHLKCHLMGQRQQQQQLHSIQSHLLGQEANALPCTSPVPWQPQQALKWCHHEPLAELHQLQQLQGGCTCPEKAKQAQRRGSAGHLGADALCHCCPLGCISREGAGWRAAIRGPGRSSRQLPPAFQQAPICPRPATPRGAKQLLRAARTA